VSQTSRTQRYLAAVSLGYLNMAVVTLVGLWLTPLLLGRLGEQDWGLWLVSGQLLGYLTLIDLGVVALVPRETSAAVGRAGSLEAAQDLPDLLGQAARLTRWQVPLVAVAALGLWVALPEKWQGLRGPLVPMLVGYVLLFPLRLYPAVLQGLQDFGFVGRLQLASWALTTLTSVTLVLLGAELHALTSSWLLSQVVTSLGCWVRLRRRYPSVLPRLLPPLRWESAREHLRRGVWVSIGQVATLMMVNTDMLLIGSLLGPAAAVPYSCTSKLVSVLANQPHLLAQSAGPALAELRAGLERSRLLQVSTAVAQAMLLVSGGVACVVLATNGAFVGWWVGPSYYEGMGLTVLLLVAMLLRHWNFTLVQALFYFGQERRLTWTGLGDALVTVGACMLLVPRLGAVGVPLGTICGVGLVSLPSNLRQMGRELQQPLREVVRPLASWAWRFLLAAGVCAAAGVLLPLQGFLLLAAAATSAALLYGLLVLPVVLAPPLGLYTRPRLARLPPPLRRLVPSLDTP
jgi:O-antigen/teichoic acid export membrane protein